MSLSYQEISHILVYFTLDATFEIIKVSQSSWNMSNYDALIEDDLAHVRIHALFNKESYSAIIVQCSDHENKLEAARRYAADAMHRKNKSVGSILALIPRFTSGKRCSLPPIKVSPKIID
jgi:hypothetical protein